ncbi:phage protease [Burkholderia cepacia]|uniref:phage protease n=1 Tax=Burkholderia cepacia TaxID=292 RepID=UPI001CF3C5BB|nr:phage protease [Burkholderia cepacia]MCA8060683.1 phage protease [Burkholderia cepacia]
MNNLASCTSLPIAGPSSEFRLLPAGRFRSDDGRPEGVGSWYVDASIAASLIAQANQKAGDFVIDYEHQSLNARQNGQPAPAAGWFKQLEWREGQGVFATGVKWTSAASNMLSAREYRYISPVFEFDGKTGAVRKIINAALTNNPALDGLVDLAAATINVEMMGQDGNHAPGVSARVCQLLGISQDSYATVAAASMNRPAASQVSSYEKAETNAKLRHVFGPGAPQID